MKRRDLMLGTAAAVGLSAVPAIAATETLIEKMWRGYRDLVAQGFPGLESEYFRDDHHEIEVFLYEGEHRETFWRYF